MPLMQPTTDALDHSPPPPEHQHPFATLTPDQVLDALASVGLHGDGRLMALSSYENRVYQVTLESGERVVTKFYRPERWSAAQIQEEHAFAADLMAAEVPAVVMTGCANMTETQRNTALGVGVGALAGAGVAKATGGKAGKGALIGAAVGGWLPPWPCWSRARACSRAQLDRVLPTPVSVPVTKQAIMVGGSWSVIF